MATYRLFNTTPEKLEELALISHNLRHFSKIWKEYYGRDNRVNMQRWEDKMDEWLKENVDYTPIPHIEAYHSNFNAKWMDTTHKGK